MSGVNEAVDAWWIRNNFYHSWPDFYACLYDPDFEGMSINVPDGKRVSSVDDDDTRPAPFGGYVSFYFGDGHHCAFGNIGNLLCYLGYNDMGNILFNNVNTPGKSLLPVTTYNDLGSKQWSRLHIAVQLLTLKGFQFKKLKKNSDILQLQLSTGFAGFVLVPKVANRNTVHVICVVKDAIIDGAHDHVIELTHDNLNWCCGTDSKYDGIVYGYEMKAPDKTGNQKKRKRVHRYEIAFARKSVRQTRSGKRLFSPH